MTVEKQKPQNNTLVCHERLTSSSTSVTSFEKTDWRLFSDMIHEEWLEARMSLTPLAQVIFFKSRVDERNKIRKPFDMWNNDR